MAPPYTLKPPMVVNFYEQEAPVNWAGMAPKPYRALLQCTNGQYYRDQQCANFIQQCNNLGIKYGLYHFLFPNNIDEQAQIYIQTVNALGGPGISRRSWTWNTRRPSQSPVSRITCRVVRSGRCRSSNGWTR